MMHKNALGSLKRLTVIVIIGLVGVGIWYLYLNRSVAVKINTAAPTSAAPTPVGTVSTVSAKTFSGTITSMNNGCESDGSCSITVDKKVVITGGGLAATEAQNTYGNLGRNGGNSRFKVGQMVEVYALTTDSGYTLQACSSCYVR